MNRLAIFDCDGTLVDSGGTIHRALDATFRAHDLVCPPRHEAQKVIGLSLQEAMIALAPEANAAALSATYKEHFIAMRGAGEVDEPLFDGILDLLDALEECGWLLGVATGKSFRGLNHCLTSHGLSGRFVTLQTADSNPSKPHPGMAHSAMAEAGAAPETTLFVGDTAWDMGCARAAGCFAIGAAWGYHTVEELLAEGAHQVAVHPSEIEVIARNHMELVR
ncbi:HAD-IA family hydrolase [Sphingomonas sp. HDW15A]|uniref:HAD-IA family hydrolase n=1 Tax=Sphingomonas sp. HDW15A TaxID=2714942 RepID=UPI00140E3C6A|nr:HAD-IA family hydrolase [Sphingomonas sp. HDW15A]QIK95255.1 HAD-IA family hydrolase [Sphingomonas sp. HDW15A]